MDKIDLVIGMLEDQGNHGAAYYVRIVREQRDELLEALKRIINHAADGIEQYGGESAFDPDIVFANNAIASAEK